MALLSTLCQRLQSVAFAVSDNSRITPPAEADDLARDNGMGGQGSLSIG